MSKIAFEGLMQTSRLPLYTMRSGDSSCSLPKLLFLGGSNTDFQIKAPVFSSVLTDHFNVASFEPRGLGRSGAPDGNWSMEDYACDAIALLDSLGWNNVALVGESFGAMTAMELAIRFPKRFAKLCLSASAPGGAGGSSYPIETFLDLSVRDRAIAALSVQNTTFPDLLNTDPENAEAIISARVISDTQFLNSCHNATGYPRLLAARAKHNVFDRLSHIPIPTVVMSGTHDSQAPIACGKAIAERIPDSEFLTFDGGHGFTFATTKPVEVIVNRWA